LTELAALFVETNGVYYGVPGVDPWDEHKDARKYKGKRRVIAHPPCERWGRYWSGGPSAKVRRILGDDNGCFESALYSVRMWGGVLEHPEGSHAFRKHLLSLSHLKTVVGLARIFTGALRVVWSKGTTGTPPGKRPGFIT
jgi:hypothetical protein